MPRVNLKFSTNNIQTNNKTLFFGKSNDYEIPDNIFDSSNDSKRDIYVAKKMKEWEKENPLNPLGSMSTLMAHDKKRSEYQKQVEEEYSKQGTTQTYTTAQDDHDIYVAKKMKEWEKENPLNPLGSMSTLMAHDKKRSEYQKQVEEEYISAHPDFEVSRTQEELLLNDETHKGFGLC